MKRLRTLWVVGAIWLAVFVLMALMTPAHYVEVSQTAPGVTHVVSSGDMNGGALGALLASALRALFYTGVISLIVVVLGSIAMGLKPFLRRIGLLASQPGDQ